MKILHVISAIAPRYGGPSSAIVGMTEALAARGHEVTVVTTDADGPESLPVELGREIARAGVRYRYFRRTAGGEWKFSWGLARWLRQCVADYDVVHVHGLFLFPTLAACRAAERAGVPYVLRPVGTLGAWSLAQRSWKKRPYIALIEHRNLARAASIHATSEAERQAIAEAGFARRARVVPLGVDLPAPRSTPERASSDGVRLLFLSRLHPAKGLPILLEAMRLATRSSPNPLSLVIAGEGDSGYRAELEALVSAHGLGECVRFAGFVAGEDKQRLLREADVFVLPSHHENFGVAVAEALAASLPVVISDQVGIAHDVEEAGAGIVVPLDPQHLATALVALAADGARRRSMAVAARALAVGRFSWESTARELESLYGELIASRLGTARPKPSVSSNAATRAPGAPRPGREAADRSAPAAGGGRDG